MRSQTTRPAGLETSVENRNLLVQSTITSKPTSNAPPSTPRLWKTHFKVQATPSDPVIVSIGADGFACSSSITEAGPIVWQSDTIALSEPPRATLGV
ncbi:hypothetical protein OPT61_g3099 [Boeremia exigua]|uniref:Uncharacterized protein n=1 Tax=Boeremia exigua TaxID=749465 RepID=A0ACC2IJ55_9PLEO|nr:hypothetical protein OPT61_g3099 [Boeremia exigua]